MKILITLLLLTISLEAESYRYKVKSKRRLQGQAPILVGVTGVPIAKTVGETYCATARPGECFVVHNNKLYYTTVEIADYKSLKKYTRCNEARKKITKTTTTGISGSRIK